MRLRNISDEHQINRYIQEECLWPLKDTDTRCIRFVFRVIVGKCGWGECVQSWPLAVLQFKYNSRNAWHRHRWSVRYFSTYKPWKDFYFLVTDMTFKSDSRSSAVTWSDRPYMAFYSGQTPRNSSSSTYSSTSILKTWRPLSDGSTRSLVYSAWAEAETDAEIHNAKRLKSIN